MNRNNIFWFQTKGTETGRRHCYLVSAPNKATAELLLKKGWMDDEDELVDDKLITGLVDTNLERAGFATLLSHN